MRHSKQISASSIYDFVEALQILGNTGAGKENK